MYKNRGEIAEFPNLWIKCKFKLRQFMLRGLEKVKNEITIAALAYNIEQWIRLIWIPKLRLSAG
ncbi:MAG: transposase [Candidatus Hydrogenedentota bacterium]